MDFPQCCLLRLMKHFLPFFRLQNLPFSSHLPFSLLHSQLFDLQLLSFSHYVHLLQFKFPQMISKLLTFVILVPCFRGGACGNGFKFSRTIERSWMEAYGVEVFEGRNSKESTFISKCILTFVSTSTSTYKTNIFFIQTKFTSSYTNRHNLWSNSRQYEGRSPSQWVRFFHLSFGISKQFQQ